VALIQLASSTMVLLIKVFSKSLCHIIAERQCQKTDEKRLDSLTTCVLTVSVCAPQTTGLDVLPGPLESFLR
jgi:hypothetical protein